MTAPLNSAMDCLPVFWESGDDGQAVSEEDDAVVPATTDCLALLTCASVVSLKRCRSFLCFSNSYGQIVVQFVWVEHHFHFHFLLHFF